MMEADESQALCGALQLIDLGSVLDAVVEQAHRGLREATVDAGSLVTDQDRSARKLRQQRPSHMKGFPV